MTNLRHPAVAGMFYPADPHQLEQTVRDLLDAAAPNHLRAKAIVAPHAGYVYSGPIAANAYAPLASSPAVQRVVLLGPSHRVAFHGIALSSAEAYQSPLGSIDIDRTAAASIAHLPQVQTLDAAHAKEHSLEVHLPFLQTTLGDFTMLPLVVGDASAAAVSEVLDHLWGGPETLVVVSSDLSHYLSYEDAQRTDQRTTRAIEAHAQDIRPEQACGCRPLNGLLHAAERRSMNVRTLDVRNSGDTAGTRDRVVGYGAYALA